MKSDKKVISLFSGAGGFDIGFHQAGFTTAVMVEMDPSCCDTLRLNCPDVPVINADIREVTTARILSAAGLRPGEAAAVIGGPPCQSFSLAGRRMGMDDPRGRLVLEFVRVVREALPMTFVMENVKGMVNWQGGKAMAAIMDEFKEPVIFEGKEYRYDVQWKVMNAANYGAPQFRERVILVGNRLGKHFEYPQATHGKPLNGLFEGQLRPYVTVEDAIGKLPPSDEPSDVAKRVSGTIKERILKHGY